MLPEDLWGMRRVDDLLHQCYHALEIHTLSDEGPMWRLRLVHRQGYPVIEVETDRLAMGFAMLLAAAERGRFFDEPAEYEKK